MGDGFQYGDLVFLGLIAVFIALRLRSILGKDKGLDPRDWRQATRAASVQDKVTLLADPVAKQPKKEDDKILEQIKDNVAVTEGLKAIKQADSHFSTTEFIDGSKLAFEWLINAYSKGEKDKLKLLLSEERFGEFAQEIDANTAAGKFHETTLVAINAVDIKEAGMHGGRAQITVQFTSEQIRVVRDKDKNIIEGDPSAVEHVVDVWTFERDTASRDPNWKIIST